MPHAINPVRPRTVHPLRILYADDFIELRNFLHTLLTRDGHLVETVADGREALDWLRLAGPAVDLLITDHHMPNMNGLDLVRWVRRTSFAGKIIVFSSELGEAVHDEYRRLGVDLILPKPIFPVTLRRMLDELFAPEHLKPAALAGSCDLVLA